MNKIEHELFFFTNYYGKIILQIMTKLMIDQKDCKKKSS